MAIATINPATGQTIKTFEPLSDAQVDQKIARAAEVFPAFHKLSFAQRAKWMLKAADILEAEKETLARIMTLEMGKTFRSAVDEAVKCAWACRYYAENAERFLADEPIQTPASRSFIRYQPLGIILVVMPWNYPFWQVFRFIAPGLMAGNVGLLKHASNVPQCALKIEEILLHAGFPEGAFQTLLIGSEQGGSNFGRSARGGRNFDRQRRRRNRGRIGSRQRESRKWFWNLAAATRSLSCPARIWTKRSPSGSRRA